MEIIDRKTNKIIKEKVWGEVFFRLLYRRNILSKFCCFLISLPISSKIFSFLSSLKISQKKILSFVKEFEINQEEFEKNIIEFISFKDFFLRRLKKEARPIASGENIVILPADAKYLVFQTLEEISYLQVKFYPNTAAESRPTKT